MARSKVPSNAALVAEFIGTFALIFIGAGTVITRGGTDTVSVALAHGFILLIMISALAPVCGGHFNPAVTFGLAVARKIEVPTLITYWAVQLAGAAAAAFTLKWLLPASSTKPSFLGTPTLAVGMSSSKGMIIEAIMTFFLVSTVFAMAVKPDGWKKLVGVGVGLVVAADIFFGGALTGAAMNTARAFGPALASSHWNNFWVYVIGPMLGGGIAAAVYVKIILPADD